MNIAILKATVAYLVSPKKGILAADESTSTCTKRFTALGIESTEASRLSYREMLFTAPQVQEYLSGVILFDETIRQTASNGMTIPQLLESKGILPGIKVDKGTVDQANFPGEKITEGLDGLRERITEYKILGAKFAKWRSVITIGKDTPTDGCLEANAEGLALYAALCQEQDIVPIIEPEVLMDGDHSLEKCQEVTKKTLQIVFDKLAEQHVDLEGILLKPNMVISGKDATNQASVQEVAKTTVQTFLEVVPNTVAGIVFLSGGQDPDTATEHLDAMEKIGNLPWQLSFSYGRALQDEALETWKGLPENVMAAQQAFLQRLKKVSDARAGI